MPENSRVICAHPLCRCPVAEKGQYCDEGCQSRAGTKLAGEHEDACDCPHLSNCYRECDLVMKGGITSGIIYPPLAVVLNKARYRFRNVGGTSAGAIAAAVVAAAEHGRAQGGFEKLEEVKDWLSKDGNLRRLFRPTRRAAPLMNTLFGYVALKRLGKLRLLRAALTTGSPSPLVLCSGWASRGSLSGLLMVLCRE